MAGNYKKTVAMCFAATASIAFFTGCNTEKALAEAAANGDVESQYELALYYNELDAPQPTKSFEWMKRAAGSRFSPAMKELALYYLKGYGTDINYQQAALWYSRYFSISRNTKETLECARQIMLGATNRIDVVAGFSLFNMTIMHENENGTPDSEIATDAAREMLTHSAKFFNWLLDARKYNDAIKLLEYTEKCYKEYPLAFAPETGDQLKSMRKKLIAHMEHN